MRGDVRGISRGTADRPEAPAGRRVALVVGIDTYAPHHADLANARNDAVAVAQRLTADFGFAVISLLDRDATAAAIHRVLDDWRATLRPADEVLVFFAGHRISVRGVATNAAATSPAGTPAATPATGNPNATHHPEGFLIPADGGATPESWLSEAALVEDARSLPAERVLLVLDACYAGTALRLTDAVHAGARQDQVIRILVAGTEDQPVLDGGAGQHSVFTRALLDGIDGLADSGQRPDGTVTARELITFVCAEVPWRSRVRLRPTATAQTPVGGTIQARPDGADFTFRPIRPRLPTTILRNLYSAHARDREAAAHQLGAMRGLPTAPLAGAELVRVLEESCGDGVGASPRGPGPATGATGHTTGGTGATASGPAASMPGPWAGTPGTVLPSPTELADLQDAAAESLGSLGEPCGFGPLLRIVRGELPRSPRPAAARALGRLVTTSSVEHPGEAAAERVAAVETLAGLVGDPDATLREAAKVGLGHVPESAGMLVARVADAPRAARSHLVDALACVAVAHPDDDAAWPRLPTRVAAWRRYHVARRRLAPRLPALMGDAGAVGIASAVGLALAYVAVTVVAFRADLRAYAPAVITVSALPGLIAGVALFALPRMTAAASRHQRLRAGAVGGLAAGLVVAAALWVPNWFLGVGCTGGADGCPAGAGWLWLVPGLVLGPALGLAVATALPAPGWPHGRRWGPALVVVLSVAGFVALRGSERFLITGLTAEVVAWAVGGFVFGLALALGWPVEEGAKDGQR